MTDLKEALDFYEMNDYLTPDQCEAVIDRIEELDAQVNRELANNVALDDEIEKRDRRIEELTDELVNVEQLAKDRYCRMQQENERLRAAISDSYEPGCDCATCALWRAGTAQETEHARP